MMKRLFAGAYTDPSTGEAKSVLEIHPEGDLVFWAEATGEASFKSLTLDTTIAEYRELLEEVLFELVSDGILHPEHPVDCGCVYSRVLRAVGEERAKSIILRALGTED